MVLDAARGIEPQTLKLFEVCRLRNIPIITFINKMDREALDPFRPARRESARNSRSIRRRSTGRPASGSRFKGMIDLRHDRFLPYERQSATPPAPVPMASQALHTWLKPDELEEARDGAELVQGAAKPFDPQSFLEGHMTPVLFGSALRHFGVDQLLESLGTFAPSPKIVEAKTRRRRDPHRARR